MNPDGWKKLSIFLGVIGVVLILLPMLIFTIVPSLNNEIRAPLWSIISYLIGLSSFCFAVVAGFKGFRVL